MTTTPSPLTALRQEHQLLPALLDLLQQEQAQLVGADTDGLAALTPRKAALVQQLAHLAAERHRALGAAGHTPEESGMAEWVAGAPAAQALWDEVLAGTRSAKELNRVNGMLIAKHMAHTQTLLHAMRAPATGGEAGIYGPSGQPSAGGPSRRYVVG